MKMRLTHRPDETFEAEMVTGHHANLSDPLVLKRKDTGEFIRMRDCWGQPGTPCKKYDFLALSADERARFDAAGLIIFAVRRAKSAPIQRRQRNQPMD